MSIAFADAIIARSREPRTWTLFLAITPTGHSHSREGFLPHSLLRNSAISRPKPSLYIVAVDELAARALWPSRCLRPKINSLWNKAFVTYDVCSMLWQRRTLSSISPFPTQGVGPRPPYGRRHIIGPSDPSRPAGVLRLKWLSLFGFCGLFNRSWHPCDRH